VAKLIVDPRSLPDRAVPIPGAKPPVFSLRYQDPGHPDEVDEFRNCFAISVGRSRTGRS